MLIMKTTAPAPLLPPRCVPQTLTLDMGLPPPAPVKRTRRKASAPQPPLAASPPVVLPSVPAEPAPTKPATMLTKPAAKKNALPKLLPASFKPTTAKPVAVKPTVATNTKAAVPAPSAVRLERELLLEGGMLWRMSGRHAVAYVQNASLACALLSVESRHLARHAMAVYYDKKGRAIAWQVRFDTQHWDDVLRRLGE